MSKFKEFEGKNVDKALEKASLELNLPVEKLKYDVVSYGSSGIFGLVGVKKAKIKVAINGSYIKEQADDSQQEISVETHEQAKLHAISLVDDAFENKNQDGSLNNALYIGKEALEKIVKKISKEAVVKGYLKDKKVCLEVSGGNSGVLIGKHGQNLDAMQYLVEKIVNKANEKRVRVQVDIEGYLENRKSNLRRLASRMAEKARRIKKPVTIGQLNAYDRRIIHLHLKENRAVRTQSIGEGYYRKLMILPKRKNRSRERKN